MNEKKEYRYSISAKTARNQTTSHEDADKNYGNGTSDFKSQNLTAEIFLTARFDEIKEGPRIIAEDIPKLYDVAESLLAAGDELIVAHLEKRGVEVDLKLQKPESAKGPKIHGWETNPYPTALALLKAHRLDTKEFADLKALEEKAGGDPGTGLIIVEKVPKEVLVDWLRAYYAAREKEASE